MVEGRVGLEELWMRLPFGLPLPSVPISAFVIHVVIHQVAIIVARVTTSYRAVEIGLSDIWIGAVGASFSLLPLLVATRIGSRIDRDGSRGAFFVGGGCVLGSVFGLSIIGDTALALLGWTALLGVGHLLCLLSQHATAADQPSDQKREKMFGHYTALISFAQIVAPLAVALFAGAGTMPDTWRLFALSVVAALVSLGCILLMRPAAKKTPKHEVEPQLPVRDLIRRKGVVPAIVAGVGVICAVDLLVIYMPVLGAQAMIPAATIATLLTVRAVASLLSRLWFSWLMSRLGRRTLLTGALIATGVGLTMLGFQGSEWFLGAAMVLIGIGIGIATPISMSWVTSVVPASSRGLVLSLRLTGNRLAQFVLPVSVGFVAAGAGVATVFLVLAVALYGLAISSHSALRERADGS
jgi:MFS family permease